MRGLLLGLLFLMASVAVALAADPAAASSGSLPTSGDAKVIVPATGETFLGSGQPRDTFCFSIRTYRVRKGLDRGSVIPAHPEEVALGPDDFDASNIVGYSTCQPAERFGLKTSDRRP
ncbi:MAG TPA: hypothetical protein VKB77_05840 [Terriglobales bacterium]|nr:hypothetical protein [Terriglobales bacterium]